MLRKPAYETVQLCVISLVTQVLSRLCALQVEGRRIVEPPVWELALLMDAGDDIFLATRGSVVPLSEF